MKRPMNFILALALVATAIPAPNASAADSGDVAAAAIGGMIAGFLFGRAGESRPSDRIEYDNGSFQGRVISRGEVYGADAVYTNCARVRVDRCNIYGEIVDSVEEIHCVINGEVVSIYDGHRKYQAYASEPREPRRRRAQRREDYERDDYGQRSWIDIHIDARPRNERRRPSPYQPQPVYRGEAPGIAPMQQPPATAPFYGSQGFN